VVSNLRTGLLVGSVAMNVLLAGVLVSIGPARRSGETTRGNDSAAAPPGVANPGVAGSKPEIPTATAAGESVTPQRSESCGARIKTMQARLEELRESIRSAGPPAAAYRLSEPNPERSSWVQGLLATSHPESSVECRGTTCRVTTLTPVSGGPGAGGSLLTNPRIREIASHVDVGASTLLPLAGSGKVMRQQVYFVQVKEGTR
jgi:hypothetical protein